MEEDPGNDHADADSTGYRHGRITRTARSGRKRNRGVLKLLRLLVLVLVLTALAAGGVVFAPLIVDDLEGFTYPAPSEEPPEAGDRNPELIDPDDPSESTYETDVETVSSQAVEDFVHAEVNDRRAEHDLEPIVWDGTIASVSRAHSADMAEREYFAHVNPDEEGPHDRFEAVADYCRAYGENVATTWVDRPVERPGNDEVEEYLTAQELAEGLVEQWMQSPDHRDAILEENVDGWDRGGVGVYLTEDGQVFATHNFCTDW